MSPGTSTSFAGSARFEIQATLGTGGMGVVYLALDRETGQQVALKTMKVVDPTAIFRFKQEFRSLAELVHPNLIRMHELICENDQWFFVMELVEGAVTFQNYLLGRKHVAPPLLAQGHSPKQPAELTATSSGADPESGTRHGLEISEAPVPGSSPDSLDGGFEGPVTRHSSLPPAMDPGDSPTLITAHPGVPGGSSLDFQASEELAAGGSPDTLPRSAQDQIVRDLPRLREAFRQLTAGVRRLHRAGMLHRDLKPANALVSRTGTVVLLDFGLVAELSAQQGESGEQRTAAGTIDYMSPEQAQALPLTEASDWYSVGVMLFQALTGRLPFTGVGLQRLQRKIQLAAPAPADLVPDVPPDLNALCVRLLQREPHRRPSGHEVADLFGVDESLDEHSHDSHASVFIGRERQLGELESGFRRVLSGETVIAAVHGRSGAGKSTLIQCFLETLTSSQQAIVLTGRCYEQETVPFKGVDSLIDALTQFLRTTSLSLRSLLPESVAALARVFPVLKRVRAIQERCQTQETTADLQELRRQAFDALRELLVRVGREHPLVIYLDDLQWGDLDSAALLAHLLGSEHPPRLLLLAAYRSEYLETSACLQALQRTLRQSSRSETEPVDDANESTQALSSRFNTREESDYGSDLAAADGHRPITAVQWVEIPVNALTEEETRQLAQRLLRTDLPQRDAGVSQIVKQAEGNAYFVHELVRHLNAGLDLSELTGGGLDDVLWSHVRQLGDEARQVLEMVAVAGQPLPLRAVLSAAGLPAVNPRALATLRADRLLRSSGPGMQAEVEAFHDRVRETVVRRLDPEQKRKHHAQLANTLVQIGNANPETIAEHLEAGGNPAEAGRYYSEAASLALQKLAFDRAEEFGRHAIRLAQTDDDRVAAHERLIHFYTDMARFADAYEQGRQGARDFGVNLPASFVPPLFLLDLVRAKWRLRGRETADLVNLPVMQNPQLIRAVRLINAAAKAAYQLRPELCVAISTKVVNLCLKHGNTPDCAIGWMVFGAIFHGGVLGQHAVGYQYGRLALQIIDRYQQERQRPEVTFVVGYFGTSWLRPAADAEALWRTTYESGRSTGDLFHTGCACAATIQSLLMRGVRLSEIWSETDRFLKFLRSVDLREPMGAIRSVRQTIRNLCGKTLNPTTFSTASFDEAEYVAQLAGYGSRHFAHYYFINKMLAQYLWGQSEAALVTAQASAGYLKDSPGMLHSAEHHFLCGLIHASLADRATGRTRRHSVREVTRAARRLSQWASDCRPNFEHKACLLRAESARLTGQSRSAPPEYQTAIESATRFGYKQVAAMAHQLASRYWMQQEDRDRAHQHQALAEACFLDWGATSHLQWNR